MGIVIPQSFRNLSLLGAIRWFLLDYRNFFLLQMAKRSWLFGSTLQLHLIRAWLHRRRGCQIGKRVLIAEDVIMGLAYPEQIIIEDDAVITARCVLLEHQRDLTTHVVGRSIQESEHVVQRIHIGKSAFIGVGTIVMPGVTIGEGAYIGAGSIVTKNIPPHCIAVGNPAKVIRRMH